MDLSGYRRFLSAPGVPRLFGSMLVGRLPAGMLGLAIVLRITGGGGSFRLAGGVSAAFAVGIGVTAPTLSRLVDRHGQTVVLVPCAFATLASATLVATLPVHSSPIVLMLAGALLGTTLPPLASISRTIWPAVVEDRLALESAYAADATFQELIFIVGPLLVVAAAAVAGTGAAILTAGLAGCVGALTFATSAASRSWRPVRHHPQGHKALHSPGIRVLIATMFTLIAGFAAMEVALIAKAREAGSPGASGILLAVWAIGSMVAGFVYGSRSWPGTPTGRLVVILTGAATVTAMLIPQHNLIVIAMIAALSGAGAAPAFSGINRIAGQLALPGVVTESYAWLSVGTLLGSATGAAAAGAVITGHGAGAGFVLAAAGVAAAGLTVALGRKVLHVPIVTAVEPATARAAIAD